MRWILLVFAILAGYSVLCECYFVIDVPQESVWDDPDTFKVFWNVPTMQCKSKKIPFNDLYEKYGIVQNSGDEFIGDKVTILYDKGLFPAVFENGSSGDIYHRNGGVPQSGNLETHLETFKQHLEELVPDENFDGIGVIDFEWWKPVLRQHFTPFAARVTKELSYQIERNKNSSLSEKEVKINAQQNFEEAAKVFMESTLSMAKTLRPQAVWGYYGFPYCYNREHSNFHQGNCHGQVQKENDMLNWLFSESTALYPSIYSSSKMSSSHLASLIRGRVSEAVRVKRRRSPVLPYFWYKYRDGGFFRQEDLDTVLETLYKSDAAGFIIWGSSDDVDTIAKCKALLQYTTEILGPSIAKYSTFKKFRYFIDDYESNPHSDTSGSKATNIDEEKYDDSENEIKYFNELLEFENHFAKPNVTINTLLPSPRKETNTETIHKINNDKLNQNKLGEDKDITYMTDSNVSERSSSTDGVDLFKETYKTVNNIAPHITDTPSELEDTFNSIMSPQNNEIVSNVNYISIASSSPKDKMENTNHVESESTSEKPSTVLEFIFEIRNEDGSLNTYKDNGVFKYDVGDHTEASNIDPYAISIDYEDATTLNVILKNDEDNVQSEHLTTKYSQEIQENSCDSSELKCISKNMNNLLTEIINLRQDMLSMKSYLATKIGELSKKFSGYDTMEKSLEDKRIENEHLKSQIIYLQEQLKFASSQYVVLESETSGETEKISDSPDYTEVTVSSENELI